MVTNHSAITGPKSLPTLAVPTRWAAKRARMITTVIGMTNSASPGSTTSRPSTADSTEIAGVIMLSARNSDAPRIPSAVNSATVRALDGRAPRRAGRATRVISERMPPSP